MNFDIATNKSGGTLGAASTTSNVNGLATVTYTAGATAGTDILRARLANGIQATVNVVVSTTATVVGSIVISTGAGNVVADGTSKVAIRATVKDISGNAAAGMTVSFTTTAGTLSAATAKTNSTGVAEVTLTAPTQAGSVTITGNVSGFSATATVNFTAGVPVASKFTLSAVPTTINPQGTSTLQATVLDANDNPVAGQVVNFDIATDESGGTLGAASAISNVNGLATVTYTAGATAGTDILRARLANGIQATVNVVVSTTATVVGSIVISTGAGNVVADGMSKVAIRATVKDISGNAAAGMTVSFITTAGTLSAATAKTNSTGVAEVTLTAPTQAGSATITGNVSGFSATATVNFTASTAQIITGTASATGTPLVSAMVTIKDSTTPIPKIVTGTTSATGIFSIDVTGMKPPYMLAVPNAGQYMFSILPAMSTSPQNVNITTLTTLVTYELSMVSGITPVTMYQNGAFSSVTSSAVTTSQTAVRSSSSLAFALVSVDRLLDLMYDTFTASVTLDSTGYSAALNTLGAITAITTSGVTLVSSVPITTIYTVSSGVAGVPSITLSLRNTSDTATVTSIDSSTPALVKATVRDANANPVSGAIVAFSTDPTYGSLSIGGKALTDASGVAKVTLSTSNTIGGAATVTATTTVAGVTASNSINYAVGASNITLATSDSTCAAPVTGITFGTNPLSAYGTTSAGVMVCNGTALYTTPITVSFSSNCAANGKATLTSSVNTVNGIASASYLDNGCNNPTIGDTVTASLSNGTSVSGNLKVTSPSLGSIQFISVVTNPATNPPMITLKGTGGVNRSETAKVTFRVVDSSGNPVGNQTVNFSLNTSIGGLSLGSASAISDPITGNVVTTVISGTVSAAVRVTATTGGLSTQSDQLIISTGIPAQDSTSISVTTHNIEGWAYDGITTTFTARLADHFHNPVPDGTAVYFTSEGGSVIPSCTTVGGACSGVTLTSQELRPANGRVTVLARAIGEEAFTDLNGNGTVDNISEMIDANGVPTDMPEAFVDYDESGTRNAANEPYFDFNQNGAYNLADGKYNGILCTSGAMICGTQKSIDVRANQTIIFSTSTADITINDGTTIALPTCVPGAGGGAGASMPFTVTVVDQNGNAMPAGTIVSFSSDNGTVTSSSFTVQDTTGCRNTYTGCPTNAGSATFGNITVVMKSDATYSSTGLTCANTNGSQGAFTVKVTTPKGNVTTSTATVTD
ncbi:hypothetical protein CCP3SC5AM1_420017 [Gammaproteobacteria bacterium]